MSSVPAGTPLKGLNFIKGKNDPVAMEDSEYPEWLWRILEDKKAEDEKGTDADIYCKRSEPLDEEMLELIPLTLDKQQKVVLSARRPSRGPRRLLP
jgi:hypothetical protein